MLSSSASTSTAAQRPSGLRSRTSTAPLASIGGVMSLEPATLPAASKRVHNSCCAAPKGSWPIVRIALAPAASKSTRSIHWAACGVSG